MAAVRFETLSVNEGDGYANTIIGCGFETLHFVVVSIETAQDLPLLSQ
tara:strand:+ start:1087 stop:1230 length:144 start_codon:yes stop_codon:yes gene_type:complete